jgi:hypothetical protein
MDEGIDIPECDSVYLTHPNYNPINFIQRISRCNRIKPFESGLENIAHVLIWAKDEPKIKKIDKLIGEYLKIDNELKINNQYIRTNKEVHLINNEHLNNNITLQSITQPNNPINISEHINLIDYLKTVSSVSGDFIDDFSWLFDDAISDNDFVVNIDKIIEWLLFKKSVIKRTLKETYAINIDYKIVVGPSSGGRPAEQILLTPKCFRRICMLTKSTKGDEVRSYIMELEKHRNIYYSCLIKSMRSEIKEIDTCIKE